MRGFVLLSAFFELFTDVSHSVSVLLSIVIHFPEFVFSSGGCVRAFLGGNSAVFVFEV